MCPGSSGCRRPGPSTKTRLTFDGAGDLTAANPAGVTCTSECGSTRWPRGERTILSKLRGFGSGFLIFSDYAGLPFGSAHHGDPTIHVFTHDSIGVGEDGPTHQPIEQLASLRAIPV